MRQYLCAVVLVFAMFPACSTFITDEDLAFVKSYEQGVYILKSDCYRANGSKLDKGTKVKLISASNDEYIKFYVYSEKETLLESKRFLLVYFFEDSFPNEKIGEMEKEVLMDEKMGYNALGREGYEKYLAEKKRKIDTSRFRFSEEQFSKLMSQYVTKVK